jgi:hypothetical protein
MPIVINQQHKKVITFRCGLLNPNCMDGMNRTNSDPIVTRTLLVSIIFLSPDQGENPF